MSPVVFLIGAGASRDAGMPLVEELTQELRERLPTFEDVHGKPRAEFPALFDAIARHDSEARKDYERFFEWIALLRQGQKDPFRKLTCFRLEPHLVTAAAELAFRIKFPIWEILRSRHQCATYQPDYLARLGDFIPDNGRLKVFTTNFDLCIEDACHAQSINLTAGFHPSTMEWDPAVFRNEAKGINLYKLHGSLNWGLRDINEEKDLMRRTLIERYPPDWNMEPQFLLGPGSKLQHDDPFVSLYAEFHQAIRQAKTCVAIGCSFRDEHIAAPIREANLRGMRVVDVKPSTVILNPYTKVPKGAKEALEGGAILQAIK